MFFKAAHSGQEQCRKSWTHSVSSSSSRSWRTNRTWRSRKSLRSNQALRTRVSSVALKPDTTVSHPQNITLKSMCVVLLPLVLPSVPGRQLCLGDRQILQGPEEHTTKSQTWFKFIFTKTTLDCLHIVFGCHDRKGTFPQHTYTVIISYSQVYFSSSVARKE